MWLQVLIVHLLRFKYDGARSVKESTYVDIDRELTLPARMFAEGVSVKQASYSLFAIINHIGAPPHIVLCTSQQGVCQVWCEPVPKCQFADPRACWPHSSRLAACRVKPSEGALRGQGEAGEWGLGAV